LTLRFSLSPHRSVRMLGTWCAATIVAATGQASVACVPNVEMPRPGESREAFEQRLEAEEAAYRKLSQQERAAIKQGEWIGNYQLVFVARVTKVKFGQRTYGPDHFAPTATRAAQTEGRPDSELVVTAPSIVDFSKVHEVFLEPVSWIKGEAADVVGWHEVQLAWTDCGPPDLLWSARPGDQVIVFGSILHRPGQAEGKDGEKREFDLFGIPEADATDRRIVEAIAQGHG